MAQSQEVYLVIGGSGLLARHIVQELLARGDPVSVLDLVQRYEDTPFYHVDITDKDQLLSAFKKTGATCVFHAASPHARSADAELFWKVNVEGTMNVLAAAAEAGVRKVVYTSSSGVIFNGTPLNGADESMPYPKKHFDIYMETKAEAEQMVLAANGKDGLLTVALRPSGIFGPGDRQLMLGVARAYDRGQAGVQIGDNKNLTDWTYVTNVAHAHVLAADKLDAPVAASDPSMAVAGEVFIITNDDPRPFWDFMRGIWDRLDVLYPDHPPRAKGRAIPGAIAMFFAMCSEAISWLLGRKPTFTRFNVTFMCTPRWHNIEKAKRALGYKPEVGIDEGLTLMTNWWKEQYPNKPSDAED